MKEIQSLMEKLSLKIGGIVGRFHFFHVWTKWKKEQFNIVSGEEDFKPYEVDGQSRTCVVCGLNEERY